MSDKDLRGTTQTPILAWLLPAALVWVVGFILAGMYDLAINQTVYSPGNLAAIVMECFGWYPTFIPALVFLTLVATRRGKAPIISAIAQLVCAGGLYLMLFDSMSHWAKRGMMAATPGLSALLLAAALVAIALYALLYNVKEQTRLRLWFVSIAGTLLLGANQIIIKAMKTFWNRTRFDDMLAAGEGFGRFTPWYLPLGNGGTSFPSGHTANAACILLLAVACDVFPALGKRRRLVYALCWAYIAVMAWARIVIGRHYLSDTLAGSAVIAGLVFALRRTKPYKNWLAKLHKHESKPEEA